MRRASNLKNVTVIVLLRSASHKNEGYIESSSDMFDKVDFPLSIIEHY